MSEVDQLQIRQAQPQEAGVVVTILQDAAHWLMSRGIDTWDPQKLASYMLSAVERGEVYLAWIENRALGTFSLQWDDVSFWGERPPDAGYLHKLAVSRDGAGSKVGQQMLAHAEQIVIKNQRFYLRLDCDRNNEINNRYYQQAGFELVGSGAFTAFKYNLYQKLLLPVNSSLENS